MRCLVLFLTVAASLCADVPVSIETRNGDTIRGQMTLVTIPMTTGFGEIEIPMEGIESITFGIPDVVRAKDGSIAQGTVQLEEFAVDSGLGRVMLKRTNLATLTVLGGDAMPAQGESYPIQIRRAFKKGDKWTVSGTVSLKGVGDVNGVKCMTMGIECRVANIGKDGKGKHDAERSGELTSTEEFVLPVDETLPVASDTMTMHIVTKTSDEEDSKDFSRSITRTKVK